MPKIKNEITPQYLRCTLGACPAVFTLSDGNLLIVGKKLSSDLLQQLDGKVASDEEAVVLNPAFLTGLIEQD